MAAGTGAKLSAFEAVSLSTSRFEARLFRLADAVDTLVSGARERITSLGGVEAHAAYGEAAEEVALCSASLDLLLVGSHGYGPLGRLIHRSTVQEAGAHGTLSAASAATLRARDRSRRGGDDRSRTRGGGQGLSVRRHEDHRRFRCYR